MIVFFGCLTVAQSGRAKKNSRSGVMEAGKCHSNAHEQKSLAVDDVHILRAKWYAMRSREVHASGVWCEAIRRGHSTSISPHAVRSVKLFGVGPG